MEINPWYTTSMGNPQEHIVIRWSIWWLSPRLRRRGALGGASPGSRHFGWPPADGQLNCNTNIFNHIYTHTAYMHTHTADMHTHTHIYIDIIIYIYVLNMMCTFEDNIDWYDMIKYHARSLLLFSMMQRIQCKRTWVSPTEHRTLKSVALRRRYNLPKPSYIPLYSHYVYCFLMFFVHVCRLNKIPILAGEQIPWFFSHSIPMQVQSPLWFSLLFDPN